MSSGIVLYINIYLLKRNATITLSNAVHFALHEHLNMSLQLSTSGIHIRLQTLSYKSGCSDVAEIPAC